MENELDNLPFDTKHKERVIENLNKRIYAQYDVINDLEIKINDLSVQIKSSELGRVSFQTVEAMLKNFNLLFEQFTDEEKKKAISQIIKEINVYEEPINGNYIKDVVLKFSAGNENEFNLIIKGEDIILDKSDIDNYEENTYFQTVVENHVHKKRKYDYIKKADRIAMGLEEPKPPKEKVVRIRKNAKKTVAKIKKPTYRMIQDYIEENYQFKVHSAYIAEVKRSYGIKMYDAPNAVETLKNPRKHPTQKQVAAITDALVHYNIIQESALANI